VKLDQRPDAASTGVAAERGRGVPWDSGDTGTAPGRIRPAMIVLLVGLVAALGLVTRTGATVAGDPAERFAIERSTEPLEFAEESRTEPRGMPLASLEWRRLSDAPIAAVAHSPVVSRGPSVVVVGARGDALVLAEADLALSGAGGIEARAAGRWAVLPPSPLSVRSGPFLAQIASERLLVWGGTAGVHGTGSGLADGAVLDAESGRWRPLPVFPAALERARTASWIDGRLVVVGNEQGAGPAAYSWSPGDPGWRRLPSPPVDTMATVEGTAAGRTLVIYGVRSGRGASRGEVFIIGFDASENRWRDYDVVPLKHLDEVVAVATSAEEILMWGRPSTNDPSSRDADTAADGLVLNATTGAWRQLRGAPATADGGAPTAAARPVGLSATWTGASMVVSGAPEAAMLSFEPTTGRWTALSASPEPRGAELAWAGGRMVRWGGQIADRPVAQLWMLPGDG
jgi:hypothetical protein